MRRRILRSRRSGQQEAVRRSTGIYCSSYAVERLGKPLPLVNEDRHVPSHQPTGVGLDNGPHRAVVQLIDGPCPLQRGGRLTDSPRPFGGNRRQAPKELVKFIIDEPPAVWRPSTIAATG